MVDCRVYFRDALGVEHSTEVRAKSLYEAVCRGWAAFMAAPGWELFEASWKAREFVVEIVAESKTYLVETDKLLEWLSKDGNGSARKKYLRRVLDGLAE